MKCSEHDGYLGAFTLVKILRLLALFIKNVYEYLKGNNSSYFTFISFHWLFCERNKKFRFHVHEKLSVPLHHSQQISANIWRITNSHNFYSSIWLYVVGSAVLQLEMSCNIHEDNQIWGTINHKEETFSDLPFIMCSCSWVFSIVDDHNVIFCVYQCVYP